MSSQRLAHRLPPLPTIKDILRLYNIRAMKQLSQNFLMDTRLTDKIVKAAGSIKNGFVCEVGPGPGNITRSILNRSPSSVIVVEKDRRFITPLEMLGESTPCAFKIIIGNVLSLNLESLFPAEAAKAWTDSPPNIHLIGNLPFNIATPLIIRWFKSISERSSAWQYGRVQMTLTFQKEVAERMVAPVLTKERCRLSVMAQNWCHVEHKFNIPGKAFIPKPEVDVGVVHFVPLVSPIIDLPFELVEKIARCLFSYRQKYCIKGLSNLFPKSTRDAYVQRMFKETEIPPMTRSFQLTLSEIRQLCYAYQRIINETPSLAKYNFRDSKGADDTDFNEMDAIEEEVKLVKH